MTIGAPAEFALTAACAIWPPSERRDRAIRLAAQDVTDWARFLRVVRRQRVDALAHHGLTAAAVALPAAVKQALEARAAKIARRNLVMSAESARLQTLLDDAGAPNLVLKGATLSALAYDDPTVKMAWDIDLLTDPEFVETAIILLRQAGYALYSPGPTLTQAQLRTLVALGRECILVRDEGRIFVELKWCLDQNPELLKGMSSRSPWQAAPLGGQAVVRTLGKDALFSYLCVHGARHCFSRLKWVADIAALIAREPAGEIERLYRVSQRMGAERGAAQALLLCERLLGSPLPPALSAELKADARTRWLVSMALSTMAGGDGEAELTRRPMANTRIALSHLLIGRNPAVLRAELKLKWISARDRMNTPLPGWAAFLYPIIRLPLFLWRRVLYAMAPSLGAGAKDR
jgi:hypothetical protein